MESTLTRILRSRPGTYVRRTLNSSPLVPPVIRRAVGGWLLTSADYRALGSDETARAAAAALVGSSGDGWLFPRVARRQHRFWRRMGSSLQSRPDMANLQAAVAAALGPAAGPLDMAERPLLVELGCGSAYNSVVAIAGLPAGLTPPRYLGFDTSLAALRLGAFDFPGTFLAGADSRALPLPSLGADIVLDGGALIHVPNWESAVADMCRIARRAVVLHTVTVTAAAPTTYLRKRAYGYPVAEVVFAESDLRAQLRLGGFEVHREWDGIAYDLEDVIGIPTTSQTWLCLPIHPSDRRA